MDLAKINDILVDLFVPILILISALILGKIFERLSLKIAEELELEKITKFPNERISVIVKYLTYLAGIILALNQAQILLISFIILLIFIAIFLVILLGLELYYLIPNIIAGIIIKRKLKIGWDARARVNTVDRDLLKKMKKAGVHLIMYGFEVGNQEVLSKTGKRTTLEQAKEAMRMTKKAKILSLGLFMLGLPGETIVSCEDTIRFANELDCDIAKFNIAVPLPGSEFFAGYIGKKEAVGDTSKFTSWFDWSSLSNSGQLLSTPQDVSSRELVDLQRKAMFSFYLKPRIIFRHLFITSFSDLYFGFYILARKYLKSFFRRSIISTK